MGDGPWESIPLLGSTCVMKRGEMPGNQGSEVGWEGAHQSREGCNVSSGGVSQSVAPTLVLGGETSDGP